MTSQAPPAAADGAFSYNSSSYSSNNNSSSTWENDYGGATIASPIAMCMAGVVGNILALLVIRRTRVESQRLMFHSLVAALVWNDLLGIVLTTPVTIAAYINNRQMPGGEHLCRFNGLVMVCFGLSTPLIVGFMAVERFLFVKHTFFYTKHCVPGAARSIVLALWAFVLFFGLLPLLGFGEYVLQYPKTWCFLNFSTTAPVYAAYGYLYSSMILLLVLVMVACNLVVVLTLARVRKFRRKHSTGSLNSVLAGDGVLDETAKQQAMAKRRTQKDIEIQMIVVVCAITAVFAICWVPLMIHILVSLLRGGRSDPLFGLVTIRLASLNQTLNPWLYVILRRTLIIRIKRVFCRWKKLLRKKTRPKPRNTPVGGGRRHQYVHVRNQLCHRNLFVGEEPDSRSLTDSMRKSLQRAVPGAMSLPDVMMLDTGRGGEQLPLPDIAKAQSFAGRVSHGTGHSLDGSDHYQLDSHADCPYCCQAVYPVPINFVSDSDCSECLREREAKAALAEQLRLNLNRSAPTTRKFGTTRPNTGPGSQNGAAGGAAEKTAKDTLFVCDIHKAVSDGDSHPRGDVSYPPSERAASCASEAVSRPVSLCHKHEASRSSFKGEDKQGHKEPSSLTSKSSSLKRDIALSKNASHSSSSRSAEAAHTALHRTVTGDLSRASSSVKSSTAGSSVKAKRPLQQTSSLEVPSRDSRPTSPVDFYTRRARPHAGSAYVVLDDKSRVNNDDDNEDDDQNGDNTVAVHSTLRTDTTTDDYGFSSMPSMPTESMLLSEQAPDAKTVPKKAAKDSPGPRQKSFLGRFGGSGKSGGPKRQDVVSDLPPRAVRRSNKSPAVSSGVPGVFPVKANSLEENRHRQQQGDEEPGETIRLRDWESPSLRSPSLPSSEASPAETRKESDSTSGIFSDESPALADRGRYGRAGSHLQKEPHSDVRPSSKTYSKEAVRKVKSVN